MSDSAARVRALAEPLAARLDVELVDVEVRGSGPRRLVRVIVDRKGGVDLSSCQRLSRGLSAALDEADPFPDRYALEVTSPGTGRPLRDRRAFARVEGRDVLVHRSQEGGPVTQLRGTVVGADDDAVLLAVEGQILRVPYEDIRKATQSLPW
jgi:ribosome maturation factor RimP